MPTIQENLANGGSIKFGTLVLAAWCYYTDRGTNEKGESIEIIDHNKDGLLQAAQKTENNWTAFLGQPKIFGQLAQNKRFRDTYTEIVQKIYQEENIRAVMQSFLS